MDQPDVRGAGPAGGSGTGRAGPASGSRAEQRRARARAERVAARTGAEQPWDPEDVAVAKGRDPTPRNVERARRELDEQGRALIERLVP